MERNEYEAPRAAMPSPPIWKVLGAGTASIVLGLQATGLLILVALHARVDRTNRRPVVTWEGPVAAWVTPITMVAALLCLVAGIVACVAIDGSGKETLRGRVGITLMLLNLIGSFFFYAFLTED